jgi:hypothetical protein
MNDDLEELLREGIDRLTAESEIPDGLVAQAQRRVARRRRSVRGAVAVGAAATATLAAVAVTGLLSASHQLPQAGHQPLSASQQAGHSTQARLAAWTVTRLANGNISVTINQLADPGGLQGTLRADGVPASVTFVDQPSAACQPFPGGTPGSLRHPATPLLLRVFPKPYGDLPPRRLAPFGPPAPGTALIEIDPSAIPENAGVQFGGTFHGVYGEILVPTVVYASAQCTGS